MSVRTSFRPNPYGLLARLPSQTSTGQVFAKMERWITECWSTGVLNASLYYFTTPPFHFLKQSFLFQLARYALVNNIFGFELANLFVASAKNTDHVAQTIHIGKNAP